MPAGPRAGVYAFGARFRAERRAWARRGTHGRQIPNVASRCSAGLKRAGGCRLTRHRRRIELCRAPAGGAVELAVRASELDPGNPSIGWLRLQLCANTPGCDIRDAATAMRWIDAENGAAWLPTLAAAQKDKDAVETDRILTDMARGVRFDLYWNRTVVLLFDALKNAGGTLPAKYLASDLSRLSEAMGIASAEIIPPFAPLHSACHDPADAERRDSCLKLSKTMQRGDTVIVQMTGFSMERRLSPPDSKEARGAQSIGACWNSACRRPPIR